HLHTCGADTRGFNNSAVFAPAVGQLSRLEHRNHETRRSMSTPRFEPAPPLQQVSFSTLEENLRRGVVDRSRRMLVDNLPTVALSPERRGEAIVQRAQLC